MDDRKTSNQEQADQPRNPFAPTVDVDMTPMVDVTFLLLIFFMVTASFSLQRSIEMPQQTSQLASHNTVDIKQQDATIRLHVDHLGGFYLATPAWEKEVVGKQSLVTCLKQASSQSSDATRLDISVDTDSRLQSLVDAIDAGTIAGFASLSVRETANQVVGT